MRFNFVVMTIEYIGVIKDWQYDGAVNGIYTDPYFESHRKGQQILRGPAGCYGYAVLDGERLIGLFEYYPHDDAMEIGLALEPSMIGRGLGMDFVAEGIRFGISEFNYQKEYIKLSVATTNYPAIRVYEKAGFVRVNEDDREIRMHWYL